MKVVGIAHGKGGVGKSTIAVNVARALQLRGLDVAIINCDAQATSQDWRASNDADELPVWDGTCDRVAYPKAMGRGLSVFDLGDEKAAAEVEYITHGVVQSLTNSQ